MKKMYSLVLFLCAAQYLNAQNMAIKIPSNANIVGSINTGKLSQLMPVEEWDKTALGKKFKEMRAKDSSLQYNSISDFGLNTNSTLYYFRTEDDSMQYNCFMIPMADASKLDKILGSKELIRLANNVRKSTDEDSSGLYLWDNQQLVYVKAIMKDAYFRNPEVAARHGLSYETPRRYYNYDDSTASTDAAMTNEHPVLTDTVVVTDAVTAVDTAVIDINTETKAYEEDEKTDTSVTIHYDADEYDFEYYKNLSIKKRLTAATAAKVANELFYTNPATSILSNSQFLKSNNANAVASIWVDKPMDLYTSLIPAYLLYKTNPMPFENSLPATDLGYKSFSASLLMDEKQMSINSQVEMTDEMAEIQEKITSRKLNKSFYKYINTDSMLGYMTWALDTRAYLEQFPALMERTYGNMGLGIGSDEISLASEFFSLLIDEEAIGNMIKGDAMVMFNGVYSQETTYTDYTYDDDFKATEVKKTKTETLPQFLMMLSSEENNLMRKLVAYGIKNNTVKTTGAFYEIEIPRSPVQRSCPSRRHSCEVARRSYHP